MSEESRTALTGILWFMSGLTLIALFVSAAAQGELTTIHAALAAFILSLAIIATPIILRWKDDSEREKAKGHRIDGLLDDLSDEELHALKQRLLDVEEPTLDHVGDDGELVLRN